MRIPMIFAALFAATQAQALSCVPPDIARAYQEAHASDTRYTMVVGRLSFDKADLPKVDWNDQQNVPPRTQIEARLDGRSLQADGFTGAWARDVTLNVLCFGPWCGGASGEEMLYFVNLDETPPSVEVTPCGGRAFGATKDVLKRALACHKGGSCVPEKNR